MTRLTVANGPPMAHTEPSTLHGTMLLGDSRVTRGDSVGAVARQLSSALRTATAHRREAARAAAGASPEQVGCRCDPGLLGCPTRVAPPALPAAIWCWCPWPGFAFGNLLTNMPAGTWVVGATSLGDVAWASHFMGLLVSVDVIAHTSMTEGDSRSEAVRDGLEGDSH